MAKAKKEIAGQWDDIDAALGGFAQDEIEKAVAEIGRHHPRQAAAVILAARKVKDAPPEKSPAELTLLQQKEKVANVKYFEDCKRDNPHLIAQICDILRAEDPNFDTTAEAAKNYLIRIYFNENSDSLIKGRKAQ
jgi:hypothetical protein